ncbi:hypothetical protein B0H66DRAFT_529731 [Apodospora peruviana]|uniref:Uncharacterized protein n=1 Tax=Apodospora peruviana TaxID=516989 RepID=A0AAE0IIP8_9PEZI|nr:hypothetical protein B0H66DRAFT_529731 [Apodospora peruviana]
MCHVAVFRSSCDHSDFFHLHCIHHPDDTHILCERPQRIVIARYESPFVCRDCHGKEWDRRDEERLAKVDDELASLARRWKSGTLSASVHRMLVRQLADRDRMLEKLASRTREEEEKRIVYGRDRARQHAQALLGLCGLEDDKDALKKCREMLNTVERERLWNVKGVWPSNTTECPSPPPSPRPFPIKEEQHSPLPDCPPSPKLRPQKTLPRKVLWKMSRRGRSPSVCRRQQEQERGCSSDEKDPGAPIRMKTAS